MTGPEKDCPRCFSNQNREEAFAEMKKWLSIVLAFVLLAACTVSPAEEASAPAGPLPVKVLLLPKFEIDKMAGDLPGEAQYYYEQYLMDSEEYDVPYAPGKLYYRDGVALCLLGMGKINAALGTMAILTDPRFDFSDAYIISTGCGGSAAGTTVMGDVFVITSAVDYDIGHHVDSREVADPEGITWFHDADYDSLAVVRLDPELTDWVYELVKDTPLETTEVTRAFMSKSFDGADWAVRDPKVQRGTTVTSDNYWKGKAGHRNALSMVEFYQCPDPFAMTEMEEIAVARTVERLGMLDRLIILRDSVNMDVFMLSATPENLWGEGKAVMLASQESGEAANIFVPAMRNNFTVGRIIIDKILGR